MADSGSNHIIRRLRRKVITISIAVDLLISTGLSVLIAAVLFITLSLPLWTTVVALLIIAPGLLLFHRAWTVSDHTISLVLNQQYPELQESSGLLLRDYSSLNVLEQLQVKRTSEALSQLPALLPENKKVALSIIAFVLLTGAALVLISPMPAKHPHRLPSVHSSGNTMVREKVLPQIETTRISIQPPSYTGRERRNQEKFNLRLEEGSLVQWQLETNVPVNNVKFIFNDSLTLVPEPTDASKRNWKLAKAITSSGFYQVIIDGQASELYTIEGIPDQPPVIHVQAPDQYTTIEFGQPQQVVTKIALSDDYGIQDVSIRATISSGSGEAVKFREQEIRLPGFVPGKSGYELQRLLSLPQLGMQPGDELYFFIKATDNHRQESRSDIYIVNLPDTAGLLSLDGLANGINLKPEYFRSQRQIIIETEQLLKDKDTISTEAFHNRSNNLGIDQKLLRLRYGKFLGEEDESGEHADGQRNELSDPSNFSNAEKLKEAFTDQHDKAEDATFFEPELKKQLKATLTEMWNAELPLRMYQPAAALPYEYKALRLLKDLQQKTRAYVAKTNAHTTPLDLQKRLTGDLSKIIVQSKQQDMRPAEEPQQVLRQALGVLELFKSNDNPDGASVEIIRKAGILLQQRAVTEPVQFLTAINAMRTINAGLANGNKPDLKATNILEKSFQRMLSAPLRLPAASSDGVAQPLSKLYFVNLQQQHP